MARDIMMWQEVIIILVMYRIYKGSMKRLWNIIKRHCQYGELFSANKIRMSHRAIVT